MTTQAEDLSSDPQSQCKAGPRCVLCGPSAPLERWEEVTGYFLEAQRPPILECTTVTNDVEGKERRLR